MEGRTMTRFNGRLNGKTVTDFTSQLDYKEKDLNRRVEALHEILNTSEYKMGGNGVDTFFEEYYDAVHNRRFNVHPNTRQGTNENDFVGQKLESMANYVLFSSENLQYNDECEYPIETNSDYKSRSRETSYEKAKDGNPDKLDEVLGREKISQHQIQTLGRITEEDMEEHSVLRELQDVIMGLRGLLKEDNDMRKLMKNNPNNCPIDESKLIKQRRKQQMRKMMGDAKRNQLDIKDMLNKTIKFNNVDSGRPRYTFWDNTGYYKDSGEYVTISNNKIEMSNYRHIHSLLSYYSGIKEMYEDDVESDWKYLLWELEDLIDNTPLSDAERDIVIWKVDQLDEKIILDKLKMEHGLEYKQQFLSSIFTTKIPKMIVETYLDGLLDWAYTHKIKGKWKTCSKCKVVKLASSRYYRTDNSKRDKLRPRCKMCE